MNLYYLLEQYDNQKYGINMMCELRTAKDKIEKQ